MRIVLSAIASKQWNLKSIDIKRAFLQGNAIDRDVLIRPPDEAETDKLWHLKKCVYGLADAPRKWYLTLKEKLTEFGCVVSDWWMWLSDSCSFFSIQFHGGVESVRFCLLFIDFADYRWIR